MNLRTANNRHKRRRRRQEWWSELGHHVVVRQSPRPWREVLIDGKVWFFGPCVVSSLNCPGVRNPEAWLPVADCP